MCELVLLQEITSNCNVSSSLCSFIIWNSPGIFLCALYMIKTVHFMIFSRINVPLVGQDQYNTLEYLKEQCVQPVLLWLNIHLLTANCSPDRGLLDLPFPMTDIKVINIYRIVPAWFWAKLTACHLEFACLPNPSFPQSDHQGILACDGRDFRKNAYHQKLNFVEWIFQGWA